MKKCFLLLGIIAGILSSTCLYAQNKPVIKMEMEDEVAEQSKGVRSNHILKLNPTIFLRGDVPIYYENNFNSNLSLEAGVGFTLKDYLRKSISDSIFGSYNVHTEEKLKVGYSFRVGLRYYSASYGFDPEGIYFGLNYRHQSYFSTLTSISELAANNEELQSVNNDVFFSVGYVYLLDENAFIDPYVGFGLRMRSYDRVGISNSTYNITRQSDVVPLLVIGLKFAISL